MTVRWVRCTAQALNVRDTPSLAGERVGELQINETVQAANLSPDGRWRRIVTRAGLVGWCSTKYLTAPGPVTINELPIEPPWMPIARAEIGEHEIPGAGSNPRVLEYLQSTNLGEPYNQTDETHWCAAFVNWCIEQARYAAMDSARALDWLHWGAPVNKPRPGTVAVFERPGGGHVGFYDGEDAANIIVLGGNQGDRVCRSPYPKSRLRGYRLPAGLARVE